MESLIRENVETLVHIMTLNKNGMLDEMKLNFQKFSSDKRSKADIMWIHKPNEKSKSGVAIIKYWPGGISPMHLHSSYELIYMLEGEMVTNQGIVKKGDMVILPSGSRHSSKTDTGCIALIIWDKPVIRMKEIK